MVPAGELSDMTICARRMSWSLASTGTVAGLRMCFPLQQALVDARIPDRGPRVVSAHAQQRAGQRSKRPERAKVLNAAGTFGLLPKRSFASAVAVREEPCDLGGRWQTAGESRLH